MLTNKDKVKGVWLVWLLQQMVQCRKSRSFLDSHLYTKEVTSALFTASGALFVSQPLGLTFYWTGLRLMFSFMFTLSALDSYCLNICSCADFKSDDVDIRFGGMHPVMVTWLM